MSPDPRTSRGHRAIAVALLLIVAWVPAVLAGASKQTPKKEKPMATSKTPAAAGRTETSVTRIVKSEAEWKKELGPERYHVLREKGTERAFTGAFWDHHARGVYRCAGCGLELFRSDEKFDSGTGWPSFWAPMATSHVDTERDASFGMIRTEATCARCGGHLGHVFDDGPKPTGMRYCINSASLAFEPAKKAGEKR